MRTRVLSPHLSFVAGPAVVLARSLVRFHGRGATQGPARSFSRCTRTESAPLWLVARAAAWITSTAPPIQVSGGPVPAGQVLRAASSTASSSFRTPHAHLDPRPAPGSSTMMTAMNSRSSRPPGPRCPRVPRAVPSVRLNPRPKTGNPPYSGVTSSPEVKPGGGEVSVIPAFDVTADALHDSALRDAADAYGRRLARPTGRFPTRPDPARQRGRRARSRVRPQTACWSRSARFGRHGVTIPPGGRPG
jgi:hypothetical protein